MFALRHPVNTLKNFTGIVSQLSFRHEDSYFVNKSLNFYLGRLLFNAIKYPPVLLHALVFFNRQMTFEVSDRCNLTCEGCHYFEDSNYQPRKPTDIEDYNKYFDLHHEKLKDLDTIHIAGAEASLELEKVRYLTSRAKNYVLYSNGIKKIPDDIKARIHISAWELDDAKIRGASVLHKAISNYRNDERAVFIITITHANIEQLRKLSDTILAAGIRVSYNHYSPTGQFLKSVKQKISSKYIKFSSAENNLILNKQDFARSREIIDELIDEYPDKILYTHDYNAWVHNPDPNGIRKRDQEGEVYCSVNFNRRPDMYYRIITSELQDKPGKCCFPDISCRSCRLYSSAWPDFLVNAVENLRTQSDVKKLSKSLRIYRQLFQYEEA